MYTPGVPNARYVQINVNIRLTVPAAARRFIALKLPGAPATARNGLARRAAIATYVQQRLDSLSELLPFWDDAPLPFVDQEEARAAVEHLRSCGWPDSQIHGWILLQRARLHPLRTLVPDYPPKEKP